MTALRIEQTDRGWRWWISGEAEASGEHPDRSEAIQEGHEMAHRLGFRMPRWDDERGVGELRSAAQK